MIGAVMAEAELVGFAAERQPEQLMAQADAKDRPFTKYSSNRLTGIGHRRRIGWPVRQKNSVRIRRKNLLRRCGSRQHFHTKAARDQPPQDVPLDSVIEGDDQRWVMLRRMRRRRIATSQLPIPNLPGIGFAASNFLDKVAADQARRRLRPCYELIRIKIDA